MNDKKSINHGAELWPLSVTLNKKLKAVHHRWLRGILGISWRDKVTNEEVRNRTGKTLIDAMKFGQVSNVVRRDQSVIHVSISFLHSTPPSISRQSAVWKPAASLIIRHWWCLAFSPLCRFAPWLIRPRTMDDSPPGSFASWLVRLLTLEVSPPLRNLCYFLVQKCNICC